MNHRVLRLATALSLAPLSSVFAAQAYPPAFDGARAEVYKTVGDTKLSLWIFAPASGPKTNRPAIVFFFGGSWANGSPVQFEPHCRHLASRGMVAITADYRVASRQNAKPVECVADAKSAVRWLRANAARLGLDPQRIAAGGGSAGGHVAAAAATLPDFDERTEDAKIRSAPDALVLFNPAAMVLTPFENLVPTGFGTNRSATELGTEPRKLSPTHHVRAGAPPTIILHGRADTTAPFATVEAFTRAMKAAGNRCELVAYDGMGHGFFNHGRQGGRYAETLAAADAFLVSLGWLPAPAQSAAPRP